MQFVELMLAQKDTHDLVAEFHCLFLRPDDVKELVLLLLVLLGQVADLRLSCLVLAPELLHDLAHAIDLLLERRVVPLHEQHLLLLLPLLLQQRRLLLFLLLQLFLERSLFSDLLFVLLTQVIHAVAAVHQLQLHLSDEGSELLLLLLL